MHKRWCNTTRIGGDCDGLGEGRVFNGVRKKLELEERLPYMIFEYKKNNNCQNYSYTSKVVGVEIMGNKYVILSLPA